MAGTSLPAFVIVAANVCFCTGKKKKKIHSFRSCDLISIVLNIIQTCLGKDTDFKGKIEEEIPVHETPPKLW